jgi:hypothetical protein
MTVFASLLSLFRRPRQAIPNVERLALCRTINSR